MKKKQHEAKKKQHVVQVKELKFRPNTDDHDYDFKKNHAIRFLQEGNRVKAVVQFRGREIAHADLGKKLLTRFAEDLATYGSVEGMPRMEGRNAHILISPSKGASPPEWAISAGWDARPVDVKIAGVKARQCDSALNGATGSGWNV